MTYLSGSWALTALLCGVWWLRSWLVEHAFVAWLDVF
jgi:hypothetical protein